MGAKRGLKGGVVGGRGVGDVPVSGARNAREMGQPAVEMTGLLQRTTRKRVCTRTFATYKQRGEWVELVFMARAAELGFHVSKPWGDSGRYDVSVEDAGRFRRVQVKSTGVARGEGGYVCYLKRTGIRYYRVTEVDFFAIYVVPQDAWFIVPARVVLRLKSNIRVAPGHGEQKYARYEEAWGLMLRGGE